MSLSRCCKEQQRDKELHGCSCESRVQVILSGSSTSRTDSNQKGTERWVWLYTSARLMSHISYQFADAGTRAKCRETTEWASVKSIRNQCNTKTWANAQRCSAGRPRHYIICLKQTFIMLWLDLYARKSSVPERGLPKREESGT